MRKGGRETRRRKTRRRRKEGRVVVVVVREKRGREGGIKLRVWWRGGNGEEEIETSICFYPPPLWLM